MGYAATTIALYGIEIENTEENAPLLEKLSSMITDEEGYPACEQFDIWLSDDFSITQEIHDQYCPIQKVLPILATWYGK
jgi:hypothetical protein